jgi:hypothetical protein
MTQEDPHVGPGPKAIGQRPKADIDAGIGIDILESHFATCTPALLSLARLLWMARQKMSGPLGTVPDDQLVWLDSERVSVIGQGSSWARGSEVEALLAELVRLRIVDVARRNFVGAEEVRGAFGFRFRPVGDWRPATRDPLRQPAPGDRFRSPSLPNCGRLVTAVTGAGPGLPGRVSYRQITKEGIDKPDTITVERALWDAYVSRMVVANGP